MFWTKAKHPQFIKRFVIVCVIVSVVSLTFLSGVLLGYRHGQSAASVTGGQVLNQNKLPSYLLKDVDFNLFWNVWQLVKSKYLEQPVADTKLFYGALAGIVSSLGDPYSNFFDPEMSDKFNSELSGTFDGIGAEIGIKKDQLQIIAPLPGTPADKSGLKAKDAILAIDGKNTVSMPVDYAVSLIRGSKGTKVILKIFRTDWQEAKDMTITRETIHVDSVSFKMMDNLAYIKLTQFNGDTIPEFEKAAQQILLKNPKGIILDMRNNPGGYFDASVKVASYWISSPGAIVEQKGQDGQVIKFNSQDNASLKDFQTIVLVDGGSASAAEIVAGALQDQNKAKLVGEKTFGKGSVQDYESLPGGSSIKITVAEWLTPNGRSINKEGIMPDVEVKFTKSDFETDKDPQLDEAIKLLK